MWHALVFLLTLADSHIKVNKTTSRDTEREEATLSNNIQMYTKIVNSEVSKLCV